MEAIFDCIESLHSAKRWVISQVLCIRLDLWTDRHWRWRLISESSRAKIPDNQLVAQNWLFLWNISAENWSFNYKENLIDINKSGIVIVEECDARDYLIVGFCIRMEMVKHATIYTVNVTSKRWDYRFSRRQTWRWPASGILSRGRVSARLHRVRNISMPCAYSV